MVLFFFLLKYILNYILKVCIFLLGPILLTKSLSAYCYASYSKEDIKIKVCIPEAITLETVRTYTENEKRQCEAIRKCSIQTICHKCYIPEVHTKNHSTHRLEAKYIRRKHPRDVYMLLNFYNIFKSFLRFGKNWCNIDVRRSTLYPCNFDYSVIPFHQKYISYRVWNEYALVKKHFSHHHKTGVKPHGWVINRKEKSRFGGLTDNTMYLSDCTFLIFSLGAVWK